VFVRILETFFRHKRLILLPLVVIPGIVVPVAWLTAPLYVQAAASAWAGTPPVPSQQASDATRYLSPAQVQVDQLAAMLRTRWMRDEVASRTLAAPLVGTQAGEDRLQSMVEKDLTITPSGNNLILLRFRSSSAELSQQFLQSVIDTYKERSAADRASAADVAASFYDGQLQDAQTAVDKANTDLRRYMAAHPEYTSSTSGSAPLVPLAAADPTLAGLENNVQYSQKALADAKAAAQQAQLNSAAAMDSSDATFQVIDAPVADAKPSRDMKTLIIFPAAAFVLGLGISATLLVLLVAGDRTARSEADLTGLPVRVLGTLPYMQLDRKHSLSRSLREGLTTRQAIGFMAGTALPGATEVTA
jgi:uncharacterized protein involved in exopolysaccharide biosynthesis